ncbi:hypothetical protein Lal_00041792 [Lupinus albus]|nr:hypothetical protein Lal_00041792 [Lupinus albus]
MNFNASLTPRKAHLKKIMSKCYLFSGWNRSDDHQVSDDVSEEGKGAKIDTRELRKQNENDMKHCLNWWDLIWFGFGALVGVGIFVPFGQQAHDNIGPAIVLSYVA